MRSRNAFWLLLLLIMIIVLSACVQKTGEYGSIYLELPLSKAEYEAAAVLKILQDSIY